MKPNHRAEKLLLQLRELAFAEVTPEARLRKAWALLASTRDDAAFALALEYATGHQMLHPDDAEPLHLQHEAARSGQAWVHPRSGLTMIAIPAGIGRLGEPPIPQRVEAFSLAMHPVTQRQLRRFIAETGYTPDSPLPDSPGDHHPATHLSAQDALAWCAWAGLHLPTQPLWERAARGDDGRLYPWGDVEPSAELAHLGQGTTAPIGSYPQTRTAWGCQDMTGNVAEICLAAHTPELPIANAAQPPHKGPFVSCGASFRSSLNRRWNTARASYFVPIGAKSFSGDSGFRPAFVPRSVV